MASVIINSGDPEHDDRPYMWPVDRWKSLLFQKKEFLRIYIPRDCRCILEFIEDADVMWEPLGYKSKDDLISNGFELDHEEVGLAAQWLKIKDPDYEIPFDVAVKAARDTPLAKPGGNNNPDGIGGKAGKVKDCQVDNVNLTKTESKGGNKKEYLLRRLSRDNPEMLDRIEAGELSTRKAAIACGIIKVKTPLEMAMLRYEKLSDADRIKFKAWQR